MPPRFGYDDDVSVELANDSDRVEAASAKDPSSVDAPVRVERADREDPRVDVTQIPMP